MELNAARVALGGTPCALAPILGFPEVHRRDAFGDGFGGAGDGRDLHDAAQERGFRREVGIGATRRAIRSIVLEHDAHQHPVRLFTFRARIASGSHPRLEGPNAFPRRAAIPRNLNVEVSAPCAERGESPPALHGQRLGIGLIRPGRGTADLPCYFVIEHAALEGDFPIASHMPRVPCGGIGNKGEHLAWKRRAVVVGSIVPNFGILACDAGARHSSPTGLIDRPEAGLVTTARLSHRVVCRGSVVI